MVRQHQPQPKPKPKPQPKPRPQPPTQLPPPPLPPPHPRAAKKSAKAVKPEAVVEEAEEGDEDELESMHGDLQRLSISLGAQRAARARAEAKVVARQGKVEELRARREGERECWAAANLKNARQKVRDKEDNLGQLERSVWQLEEWVAWEAKVKEEVEEKMVEEKVTGSGDWLSGFCGVQAAGAIMHLSWDPAVLSGLHPPNLDHPLLVPRRVRFGLSVCRCTVCISKIWGKGAGCGRMRAGCIRTNPCGWGGGGLQGTGGGNHKYPGGRGGKCPLLQTRG